MYPGASQLGSPRELSAVWSGWLSVWRASRSLEVLVVSVLCAGVLCLFYPEVILEHRGAQPADTRAAG